MLTVLILSQKGGSSKTMLTAHLAVEAERCSESSWVIDTDRQATLSQWHERRAAETPQRLSVEVSQIELGLAQIASKGAAYCFIDTAGNVSEQNTALLTVADYVLIPVRPSPSDLWAVAETVSLVKDAAKPFLFIVTQAKPQANITAQAIAALSKHGRVAQSFISDRVAYAAAMTGGSTAPELKKGVEAQEVSALWNELKSFFHENSKALKKELNG